MAYYIFFLLLLEWLIICNTWLQVAAKAAADAFIKGGLRQYEKQRSRADVATVRDLLHSVTVHLRAGELSPRYLFSY